MTTFFTRVDKYEPSIMVIRTSDMEVGAAAVFALNIFCILFHFLITCVLSFPTKPVHKGFGGLLFRILG